MLDLLPKALAAAYGSLQAPNYAFVDRTLRQRPYRALVAALEQVVAVEEITEPNYDVSFGYVLGERAAYLLHLSMVGPFAALFPLGPNRTMGAALVRADSEIAETVLRLLSQHGLVVIDAPTLSLSTEVKDLNSGQDLSIYEALFCFS